MTEDAPDLLTVPFRFNTVQPRLYRGAYPREINLPFLRTLLLHTIVSLTPEPILMQSDPNLYEFAHANNISLVHLECASSGKGKKRGVPLGYGTIIDALSYIIHNKHAPVYIHCLNGGQATSLVIACLRKLQFWSSISIFKEFINFTSSITVNDRAFVNGFKGEIPIDRLDKAQWLWIGMSKGVVNNNPRIKVTEQSGEKQLENDDTNDDTNT